MTVAAQHGDGRATIRLVSATRCSREEFFSQTALGQSLRFYRTFPRDLRVELRLFPSNSLGLPAVYNTAIDEAATDPALLVFVHDDVFLNDFHWATHVSVALDTFDLVGLAGNRRRVPRQPSWMYLDDQFTRDESKHLSGVLGHGKGFPELTQLSVYGPPGQEVKLLDGVFLAIHSDTLRTHQLRFDPQFDFHFYDLDFCRQVELRDLRMGTFAASLIHGSAGELGGKAWQQSYQLYLRKYGE
jgi:hypothetical protein